MTSFPDRYSFDQLFIVVLCYLVLLTLFGGWVANGRSEILIENKLFEKPSLNMLMGLMTFPFELDKILESVKLL